MTFLSAKPVATPAVAIIGVPYDGTSTFRAGSRHAPEAIRWASQSIESYSPVLRRDLERTSLADLGDIDVAVPDPLAVIDAVRERVERLPPATLPAVLGGEHTITLGVVQALRARYRDLAVLQLDAHPDLRDEYEGQRLSHATVMRRVLEVVGTGAVVGLGLRAGAREEFEFAPAVMRFHGQDLAMPPAVWSWLEQRPLHVTIDIDIVDPAEAPGTGNPEPQGVSGRDLLMLIRRLSMLRVVGFDVVEVSPPYDPSGRTAVLAATIVREAILSVSGIRGSGSVD